MSSVFDGTAGVDDEQRRQLAGFLGLEHSNWMMSPSERIALIGLLQLLRPAKSLEIGYAFGGSTEQLSRFSAEVYTVDVHERILESSQRFSNVTPHCCTSRDAFERFLGEGLRFDFCLLDGDHTRESAAGDLRMALKVADVIVMHDSANVECRSGYEDALAESEAYANLDWIDGRIQIDGAWGGFGIAVPSIPQSAPYRITPIVRTTFELIRGFLQEAK